MPKKSPPSSVKKIAPLVISAEDLRKELANRCEEYARASVSVFVGNSELDAPIIITPASQIDAKEFRDYIPLTTGQLRKDFTSAQNLIRYRDAKFMVMNKSERLVSLTRNTAFKNPALERLCYKAPEKLEAFSTFDPLPATSAFPSHDLSREDLTALLIRQFEEIEKRDHRLADRILAAIEARKK